MSTGIFPSMLGMIVRSSPAPVIARICDWLQHQLSRHRPVNASRRRFREADRTAWPPSVCEQPAARSATTHQTANGLADMGMAHPLPGSRRSRIEYCSTSECFRRGDRHRVLAGIVSAGSRRDRDRRTAHASASGRIACPRRRGRHDRPGRCAAGRHRHRHRAPRVSHRQRPQRRRAPGRQPARRGHRRTRRGVGESRPARRDAHGEGASAGSRSRWPLSSSCPAATARSPTPARCAIWPGRWPRGWPPTARSCERRLETPVVVQFDEPSLPAALEGRLTGVTSLSPVHPVDESVAIGLLDDCVADRRRRGGAAQLRSRFTVEGLAAQQHSRGVGRRCRR